MNPTFQRSFGDILQSSTNEYLDFIDILHKARNLEECWSIFLSKIRAYGFSSGKFMLLSKPHSDTRKKPPLISLTNYSEAWQKRYEEAGHYPYDRSNSAFAALEEDTLIWGDPRIWGKACRHNDTSPRQMQVENEAREFDMHQGLSIFIDEQPMPYLAGIGLAMTRIAEKEYLELIQAYKDHTNLLTKLLFYASRVHVSYEQRPELSNRELECLKWMAIGYSSKQIAGELAISRKTVEHHIGSIRQKLDARNSTHAVASAIRRNLIA